MCWLQGRHSESNRSGSLNAICQTMQRKGRPGQTCKAVNFLGHRRFSQPCIPDGRILDAEISGQIFL